MNQKKCLKCGHVTTYSGAMPLACADCGAVYQKVEAALSSAVAPTADRPMERTAMKASTPRRSVGQAYVPEHKLFAENMRSESLYPTWRELVKWITFFWYGVAVIALVGTVVAAGFLSTQTYIALVVAVGIVIFARAGKELSLMLTDLADATVRMAARDQER